MASGASSSQPVPVRPATSIRSAPGAGERLDNCVALACSEDHRLDESAISRHQRAQHRAVGITLRAESAVGFRSADDQPDTRTANDLHAMDAERGDETDILR